MGNKGNYAGSTNKAAAVAASNPANKVQALGTLESNTSISGKQNLANEAKANYTKPGDGGSPQDPGLGSIKDGSSIPNTEMFDGGIESNAVSTPLDHGKKNWWTGEGFDTDHILSQASADDPSAIGAGTLFGGKKGGGIGGLVGATLRSAGAGMIGSDPSFMTESSLYSGTTSDQDMPAGAKDTKDGMLGKNPLEEPEDYEETEIDAAYPVESGEKAEEFRNTFKEQRALKERTFKWIASDGIEREYSTQLKGEDADEWMNFLNSTSDTKTASDTVEETISTSANIAFDPPTESQFTEEGYDRLRKTQFKSGLGDEFEPPPIS